jgi:hypothetical protein
MDHGPGGFFAAGAYDTAFGPGGPSRPPRRSFGLTAAPVMLIIDASDLIEVFGMRTKRILLFALGVFAVVAAFLSILRPKE